MKLQVRVLALVVFTRLCCVAPPLKAQEPITAEAKRSEQDEVEMNAQAFAIRQRIVHGFGTPEQIAAFDRGELRTEVKAPAQQKRGRETGFGAAYLAFSQTPDGIYGYLFSKVIYSELSEASGLQAPATAARNSLKAKAMTSLENRLPLGAGGVLTAEAAQHEADKAIASQEDRIGDAYGKRLFNVLSSLLSPAEVNQYKGGSYKTQAQLLFRAGLSVLGREPVPNAYILMLCDPAPIQQGAGFGELFILYPDEAIPFPATQVQKWKAAAHLQARFMRDGAEAFAGEKPSQEFLSRLSRFPVAKTGISSLLRVLGPSGAKQYQSASNEEKAWIENTAIAITIGVEIVVGTFRSSYGDADSHSLQVAQPTSPPPTS